MQEQGLSQNLETGCLKLAGKMFGYHIFQQIPQYAQITTIDMYLLIEIVLNIPIQCHGNYYEVEKLNIICLKLRFYKKYSQKI